MRFDLEICFGHHHRKTMSFESSHTIAQVIQQTVSVLSLPLQDDRRQVRIIYGLYREKDGARERIQESRTLAQLKIQPREDLYLSDAQSLWWETPQQPPPPSRRVTDQLPKRPLPAPSKSPPDGQQQPHTCRLRLAPNCVVVVQGDHLELNRNYLINHLPSSVVFKENARIFSGFDTRLEHVGRERHGEIFRQHEQWIVRAYKPICVQGHSLDRGQSVVIQPPGAKMVLGRGGWEIDVELVRL